MAASKIHFKSLWQYSGGRKIARYVSLGAFALSILWVKLTRTLLGTLILLIAAWNLLPVLHLGQPFTLRELALWVDEQDTTAKTAVFGSMLTVLGFVVAFGTAVKSWKLQRRTELRIAAGEEISALFSRACTAMIATSVHLNGLLEAQKKLAAIGTLPDWHLNYLVKKARETDEALAVIQETNLATNGLKAKHENILVDQPLGIRSFEFAQSALEQVAEKIAFVTLSAAENPTQAKNMLAVASPHDWQEFIATAESCGPKIAAGGAAMRAAAVSDVLTPKWAWLLRLAKTSKQFMQVH